jgi:hypothetical protein
VTDGIKAWALVLLILIVLLGDSLSDWANRRFWLSPAGWLIGQVIARRLWYSDEYPWWKRWACILGLPFHPGQGKRGRAIDKPFRRK